MQKFACPSCGAEIVFQSNLSVYAICAYCSSMVVRRDVDVEKIGVMSALPRDASPLQLGTEGHYEGVGFRLIGRMKIGWRDGAWNEWFMLSDDGRKGWLAEAQGTYAVCFETAGNIDQLFQGSVHGNREPQLGAPLVLEGKYLRVVDIKDATCIGSEGELPFVAPKGRETTSIDLVGPNGEFATVELDKGKQNIYLGRYLTWDELHFSNVKPADGITNGNLLVSSSDKDDKTTPILKPKTFACPSCGGTVTIKAVGTTITVVCSFCSSLIDVANDHIKIITTAEKRTRNTLIPIGAKGVFGNITWEAIGYTQKADGSGEYLWDEYLLYHPYHGYRFLVQANGHWNFATMLKREVAQLGEASLEFGGTEYKLFLKGKARVKYVKGEFYWRVKQDDVTKVMDYIAPPYMLSVEEDPWEKVVTQLNYLEPVEIKSAFNLSAWMPSRDGVAPNQPSPFAEKFKSVWTIGILSVIAAYGIYMVDASSAAKSIVFEAASVIPAGQKDQTFASAPFLVPKKSNLLIKSSAQVANDWAELNYSLVNTKTNDSYNVTQPIEYYYGSDIDGAWSEGKTNDERFVSALPAGEYRLLIDVDGGALRSNQSLPITVKAIRDVPNVSNYLFTMALILIYPLWVAWRRMVFEQKRWSESDYAPSQYRTEQD